MTPYEHILRTLGRRVILLQLLTIVLAMLPALRLIWEYNTDNLGINPLERLIRYSGEWTFLLLLLTLAVTPCRRLGVEFSRFNSMSYGKRLSDWNWIVKLRRALGLLCFFYALMHAIFYVYLDQDASLGGIWLDIKEKSYIVAGVLSFILLIPLAITSTDNMMRRLKKNWRRIHRLIYIIGVLALLHYYWLSKLVSVKLLFYGFLLSVLLLYRVFSFLDSKNNKADSGMEVLKR